MSLENRVLIKMLLNAYIRKDINAVEFKHNLIALGLMHKPEVLTGDCISAKAAADYNLIQIKEVA